MEEPTTVVVDLGRKKEQPKSAVESYPLLSSNLVGTLDVRFRGTDLMKVRVFSPSELLFEEMVHGVQ